MQNSGNAHNFPLQQLNSFKQPAMTSQAIYSKPQIALLPDPHKQLIWNGSKSKDKSKTQEARHSAFQLPPATLAPNYVGVTPHTRRCELFSGGGSNGWIGLRCGGGKYGCLNRLRMALMEREEVVDHFGDVTNMVYYLLILGSHAAETLSWTNAGCFQEKA